MPTTAASSTADGAAALRRSRVARCSRPPLMIQFLQPPGDEEEAIGVAVSEVAGAQPAVGRERRRGRVRGSCNSRTSRWAHGSPVRRSGRRPGLQRGVDDARFAARRTADGTQLALGGSQRVENDGATVPVRPMVSMTPMPKRRSAAHRCSGGSAADAERRNGSRSSTPVAAARLRAGTR